METVLIIGVAILIVVSIIVATITADRKRTESMQKIATELSLTFSKDSDARLLAIMNRFKLFNRGRARKIKNVMQADTEIARLSIFDYQYTTGGGNNSRTHRFSVVSMESDELNLPDFGIRPEGFFDRIGSMLGRQDIDFTEDPAFSDAFVLSGSDETRIRNFMTAELRQELLNHPDSCIESDQGVFIFYSKGRRKAEQIRELMDEGFGVYTAFRDACASEDE